MAGASKIDVEQRSRVVRECLAKGFIKSDIKAEMRKRWPNLSARTIENYIRAARHELSSELETPLEDWRASALDVYRSILRDPTASHRDKIRAQARIDKLLGLEKTATFTPAPPVNVNPTVNVKTNDAVKVEFVDGWFGAQGDSGS